MTFPIVPAHEAGLVLGVVIGFAFGFVLERAGFGRAPKLAAQFYGHDMTVFKVMFGAIVTATLGLAVGSAVGLLEFKALADRASSGTFLVPMIAGGLLLGAGFILSGYCPGTSFVATASGKLDGLVTVGGVVVGQVIWAELETRPGFVGFHDAGALGNYYLWELLRLPASYGPIVVALAVTAMAIGCFAGAEKLEKALACRATPNARATAAGSAGGWVFAGFTAAAAVALLGLALPSATPARPADVGLIDAAELARRVFDEPWTVRVLDTRPRDACAARRIPGAECVPSEQLAALALGDANGARDLVIVGARAAGGAPAEVRAYPGRVLELTGGWQAWESYALSPPPDAPPDAPPDELARHRLRAGIHAALTGMKTAPPPPVPAASSGGPPKRAGGGGCSG
jgi:hypothetical protein